MAALNYTKLGRCYKKVTEATLCWRGTFRTFPFGGPKNGVSNAKQGRFWYLQDVQPRWLRGRRVLGFFAGTASLFISREIFKQDGCF